MLEERQNELRIALERKHEAARIESHVERIRRGLDADRARRRDLQDTLAKEGRDVRRLEGLSLTALFHSILGGKEEKLAKERREFLEASVRVEECAAAIEAQEADAARLAKQRKALGNVERALAEAYRRKEWVLSGRGGPTAARLIELTEETAREQGRRKELREALDAADDSLDALLDVEGYLDSARNWGGMDMVMGGVLVTAMKHGKIDDANRAARLAQRHMTRLARELEDVNRHPGSDLELDLGSFLTFADYFFDGLIIDWHIQNQINETRRRVQTAIDELRDLHSRLQQDFEKAGNKLVVAEAERRKLIEMA